MTIVLSVLFLVAAVGWIAEIHFSQVERSARKTAEAALHAALQDKHDIANSAMRGAPAIKWHRPYPIPNGADAWYWLIRSENVKFLFTDEARKEAEQRARLLLIA